MRDMTISEIESLTYEEAKENAIEVIKIKEHDCVFINFEGYFGYSVLVFKNGKHIYYANHYQLHHPYTVREYGLNGLRDYYIETLKNKLYTEEELMQGIENYDEYQAKDKFLRNYWIMKYDSLSIFGIGKEAQMEFDRRKPHYPFYSPISFCYLKKQEVIDEQMKYHLNIVKEYTKLKENMETFKEMIRTELYNHEACITCDPTDALDALGLSWKNLNDEQRDVVRKELNRQCNEYCEGGL